MDDKKGGVMSRRGFLKAVPVGIAGMFALTALGGRFGRRAASDYPKFPDGSIFAPAKDRDDA